jgi:cytochrome c oxidase subunit I
MFARERVLASWYVGIALVALAIGSWFGPLQALEHAGVDLYPTVARGIGYYQGLTIHGVLNALVWTTFFIVGFFTLTVPYGLGRPLAASGLNIAGLVLMAFGVVLAGAALLTNNATVLYTFYPPMQAHWSFYLGLTLVVAGSWVPGWGFFATYRAWRREHPAERTPLLALASLITVALWQICTLGVAAEMLGMLLPWSVGLLRGTDPLLARTEFWFMGHALVYFWLLPAYVSWYFMLPKQAGGKLFSEPLARLAFWLFLVLSTPVGLHHQFLDPGISRAWKAVHGLLTYGVFFPSAMTAFTVIASLEIGARARGGRGLFGWMRALPWGDPSYAAQNLAMIMFAFGGIGGLVNASYNVNLAIHNTLFVAGHFHLTVATAVTLTFMGILYWLVPHLSGRQLWAPKLALWQAYTWFAGMLVMSGAMHLVGLMYTVPRRVSLGSATYLDPRWQPWLNEAAAGGVILWISLALFFVVIVGTWLRGARTAARVEMPLAEVYAPPGVDRRMTPVPVWLDSWGLWLSFAVLLIVLAYGPVLINLVGTAQLNARGFRVW